MKRKIVLFTIIALSTIYTSAQMKCNRQTIHLTIPDSTNLTYYSKPRLLQGIVTTVGLNIGVWAFDRYIQKGDFAYISTKSIRENFKHGFIWDNDKLSTNMFLHPYHGNLYFNAARSNGFNYWQSGLFAFGGSAMWELFMESEYPSTNDIIATPIGGMILGEMLYRTSDVILDDRTSGSERTSREIVAFVVSPMRGLTRVINGDVWKRHATSGRQFGTPDVCATFSAGVRALEFKDDVLDKGIGFTTEINIEYGDKFNTSHERPFDFFTFRTGLNIQQSQPVIGHINIIGRLLNCGLVDKDNTQLNVGVYQHFDFYDSDTISDVSALTPYKLATPAAVGGGLQFRQKNIRNWDITSSLYGNAIIMGAVLSDYYHLDQRNYNIANGFGTKLQVTALYKENKFSLSLSHEFYRMFTWKGYEKNINWATLNPKTLNAQGDESQASVHVSEFRIDYRISKRLFITGSFMHFHRDTNYRYYPDIKTSTTSTRLMLSYIL